MFTLIFSDFLFSNANQSSLHNFLMNFYQCATAYMFDLEFFGLSEYNNNKIRHYNFTPWNVG